jgi:hypothetical protein
MTHEEGIAWTGAGIDSPHPLQKTQKSCIRDGGRLNTNPSIGEEIAKCRGGNYNPLGHPERTASPARNGGGYFEMALP